MEPAYPPRVAHLKNRNWGCTLPALGLFGFFAWAGLEGALAGYAGPLQWAALAFVLWLFWRILKDQLWARVRLIPIYERHLPHAQTFCHGDHAARNLLRLDEMARVRGQKGFSDYGFADRLMDEPHVWFEPAEGLATVSAMLAALVDDPNTVDDPPGVMGDLERMQSALTRATREGTRFSWILEIGEGTSGLVWERRQAFP